MPAGVEIFNSVLNQLGSPAIYSDVFANRPAFGYTGRLFISTDTNEIYRDTGTSWVLISSGGGGVNIYNSDGTLTAARTMTMAAHTLTFEGGASVNRIAMSADNNVARIFSFRTAGVQRWAFRVDGNETGSNAGADFALRSYNDAGTFIFSPFTVRRRTGEIETFAEESITTGGASVIGLYTNTTGTYASGLTTTGGNPQTSNFNIYTLATAGSVTFANSNLVGTTVNVLRAQVQNAGTVTFPASGTSALRAATNFVSQLQYNTSAAAGTYTHMANIHLQGVYEVSGGNLFTITNAYQLLLNSLNENGYTGAQLALTNRWGIYQDGASDLNYFAANTLLGTTTNTGERLQVAGTSRFNGTTTTIGDIQQSGANIIRNINSTLFLQTDGAAQPIVFRTAGAAERMRITSAGDVGIGTNTPYNLPNYTSLTLNNATNGGLLAFQCNGVTTAYIYTIPSDMVFATLTTAIMRFFTNTTEKMRITSGGNVLIGTTTDAGELLQVNGTVRSSGAAYFATTTGSVGIALTNATISGFRFDVNGTSLLRSNTAIGPSTATFGTSATNTFAIYTGATAPSTSPADCFQLYSADVSGAGTAAAHFRTENGAVIKVYQETTAVGAATLVGGGGTTITDTDTFDGYTLQQIVKALKNQGLLA